MSVRILGIDTSLNHSGFVQLDDGEITNHWFITQYKVMSQKFENAFYSYNPKDKKNVDFSQFDFNRIVYNMKLYRKIVSASKPDLIAIEDYAYAKSMGAHQIGENGAIMKLAAWMQKKVYIRMYAPTMAKKFAVHDGVASKPFMMMGVMNRWKTPFEKYLIPISKGNRKHTETAEDLCDAMAIAKLCHAEFCLRKGIVTLEDLEHDAERQVFLTVQRKMGKNLLAREWVVPKDV